MNTLKWVLILSIMILNAIQLAACGVTTPMPTFTATATTTTPSLTPLTPSITLSPISTITPLPTNTLTASPEPNIAPNCRIANEGGRLYLLSDKEFRSLFTTEGKLNRALTAHYLEWANYKQMVSWNTQPVKLGEIIVSASLNEELNLQINPAVTLVTLGDSLDWQLPSNMDLFLRSREISTELNRLSLDWDNPYDESLRRQYPEVANSGTYAFYIFFNSKLDSLQRWCETYQLLFGIP